MILTMNYLTLYDSVQYQLLKSAHLHNEYCVSINYNDYEQIYEQK